MTLRVILVIFELIVVLIACLLRMLCTAEAPFNGAALARFRDSKQFSQHFELEWNKCKTQASFRNCLSP